jgi:site-specific recombinase XerD
MLEYARRQLRVAPSSLQLEQLDAPFVLSFLAHLRGERKNGAASRNARLSAIKSFMRFLEHRVPSALDLVHRILAIPAHKKAITLVQHLRQEEYQALLDAPSPSTRLGVRDRAMLHLALAGGLRASELVGLLVADVRFDGGYVEVHVRGKGRKERVLLLWREVARSLRQWLNVRGPIEVPEVFPTARGDAMTRAGLEYLVKKYAATAAKKLPSLGKRSVSPHILRHTCAVNMLRATGDTRKVALWLGHANSATTDAFYLNVDPTEKLEALTSARAPVLRPGRFRPADRLLESLRTCTRLERSTVADNLRSESKDQKRRRKSRRYPKP